MATFHKLTIKDIKQETPDCVSVSFQVPENMERAFDYLPGQYVTLRKEINGEDLRRSYSICSAPLDQELRVAVKKIQGGRFSTFANDVLQIGDELAVLPPEGRFVVHLDPANQKHYVAFAAGSGITPILSILKSVLLEEPESRVTLFYGNRTTESIIFREVLEGLKNEHLDRLAIHHILSKEKLGSPLFFGRIDREKCRSFLNLFPGVQEADEFFICGPEEMLLAIQGELEGAGIKKEKIHFELFTTSQAKIPVKTTDHKLNQGAKLLIQLDGDRYNIELSSAQESVLDAALKGGADLPFSCKGGVCCTCRAKLVEGEVEMHVNYALEQDELDAGYILTCQSFPKTDFVQIDFDA